LNPAASSDHSPNSSKTKLLSIDKETLKQPQQRQTAKDIIAANVKSLI